MTNTDQPVADRPVRDMSKAWEGNRRKRRERIAAELRQAGWLVQPPESSRPTRTEDDGREDLARSVLSRFPPDSVLTATNAQMQTCRQSGDEFSWQEVLDAVLTDCGYPEGDR